MQEEYTNVITLTDSDGSDVDFEVLDIVPYNDHEYAVLLPVDDESDSPEAVILELLEAEGLRDKFVVCCGGPRITHELAKELGYDAGFGAGKYADDVASFAVTEMVKRGMK